MRYWLAQKLDYLASRLAPPRPPTPPEEFANAISEGVFLSLAESGDIPLASLTVIVGAHGVTTVNVDSYAGDDVVTSFVIALIENGVSEALDDARALLAPGSVVKLAVG